MLGKFDNQSIKIIQTVSRMLTGWKPCSVCFNRWFRLLWHLCVFKVAKKWMTLIMSFALKDDEQFLKAVYHAH